MLATSFHTPKPSSRTSPHLAGDLAIWIFILAELGAFAVFFGAYAFTRAKHVADFNTAQLALNRDAGALNTLLLLTASAFVVRAVQGAQMGSGIRDARWMLGAIACGMAFLIVKGGEYSAAFDAGISLSSSIFHMFYLSLTFFHFMHVILGLVILAVLWNGLRLGRYGVNNMNRLESGAAYWHMVDMVWLILFPLIYVIH
ncbi:MAG: cytochrome c oxidase subunit 3 [Dechloromonas sp.]|nr:cytochrome c oxidase subunit 3 [Dechloromonas sp.]